MLINNWYVACTVDELQDQPKRVQMLAHDFVLFRDEKNIVRCLSDYCVHRGAMLSQGTCHNGILKCPQHGWEYNGDGNCTLIPAGSKTPTETPRRARVPSYPVIEKYGLIFVFLGDMQDEERPAVVDIMPEWDTDEWHKAVITRDKDVNFIRLCENYNDPCHVHYIHEFAKWLPKGVTIIDHELSDQHLRAWHASHNGDNEPTESAGLMMIYNVISCVSRNTNYQPDYPPQIVTAYTTPIDERNTRIFMVILMPRNETTVLDGSTVRGATEEEHKAIVNMTRDVVMDEDHAVLRNTRPRLAAPVTEELLVETDRTLVQVRKITADYGSKYGMVDTRSLRELEAAHITVIPSPAHKSDPKNWVHRTAPILSGEQSEQRGTLKDLD